MVVSRQPILDNVERIVGFELLTPPEAHPHEATAGVLSQAIADIGLLKLVGDRPAHVDVTREFLLLVSPLPLDPERVVLEIAADEHIDDELLAVLQEIRTAGFRIALDGFRDGIGEGSAAGPRRQREDRRSATAPKRTSRSTSTPRRARAEAVDRARGDSARDHGLCPRPRSALTSISMSSTSERSRTSIFTLSARSNSASSHRCRRGSRRARF